MKDKLELKWMKRSQGLKKGWDQLGRGVGGRIREK